MQKKKACKLTALRKTRLLDKKLFVLFFVLFSVITQTKAQTKKDTTFLYDKTVYVANDLAYSIKDNKLLDDTTFYLSYPVDSVKLWMNYPAGTIHIKTTYVNGKIYLKEQKVTADPSKYDPNPIRMYNGYGAKTLNKKTYFLPYSSNKLDTNRDKVIIEYYPNGRLKKIDMRTGKTGEVKRYRPNGNLGNEVSYVDNHINGLSYSYFKNGLIKYEIKSYLGQLIYEKGWQLGGVWGFKEGGYSLIYEINAVPFLLLDSLKIPYKKKPSDSIYLNRKLWLSSTIHPNDCGCILINQKFIDEDGSSIWEMKYKNGKEKKKIDIYPYKPFPHYPYFKAHKMVEVFNQDTVKKPYLKSKIFYYNEKDSLITKDINYNSKTSLRSIRLKFQSNGKVIKEFYDKKTKKYVAERKH